MELTTEYSDMTWSILGIWVCISASILSLIVNQKAPLPLQEQEYCRLANSYMVGQWC
jgi:hypothetical protein